MRLTKLILTVFCVQLFLLLPFSNVSAQDLGNPKKCIVTFTSDESKGKLTFFKREIDCGTSVTSVPTVMEDLYYRFIGWSTDGTNLINIKDIIINEDTTFSAVFEFTSSFNVRVNIFSKEHPNGLMMVGKEPADFEYQNLNVQITNKENNEVIDDEIKGNVNYPRQYHFSKVPQGTYMFNVSNYPDVYKLIKIVPNDKVVHTTVPFDIEASKTSDILLTFKKEYPVTFEVDATKGELVGEPQQNILYDDPLTDIPTITNKGNFEFVGWSTDGSTVIDLANYKVTDAVKFIAVFKDNTPKTSHLTITVKLYSKDHNGIMQFGKEPEDFGYNTLFDLEIVNKDTGVSYKPQHLGAKGFARAYSFLKIPEGVYTVKVNNYSDLYKMTTVLPTDINVPHGNTYSIEFRKLYKC